MHFSSFRLKKRECFILSDMDVYLRVAYRAIKLCPQIKRVRSVQIQNYEFFRLNLDIFSKKIESYTLAHSKEQRNCRNFQVLFVYLF